jgi:hypothetical protein
MANVPNRKRVFVKFQSANSPVIDLYREVSHASHFLLSIFIPTHTCRDLPFSLFKAFPNVPFIFLYREPTEVLVSHFFHGPKV